MTGGFKAWAAEELPVLEGATEYDASTGAVLGDNVEVLAEKANEAVKTVSQPQVSQGGVLGEVTGCYDGLHGRQLEACVVPCSMFAYYPQARSSARECHHHIRSPLT